MTPLVPNPTVYSMARAFGTITAVCAALTISALWLGIVVGVAIRMVRAINGW